MSTRRRRNPSKQPRAPRGTTGNIELSEREADAFLMASGATTRNKAIRLAWTAAKKAGRSVPIVSSKGFLLAEVSPGGVIDWGR